MVDFSNKKFPHEVTLCVDSPVPVRLVQEVMRKAGAVVVSKPFIDLSTFSLNTDIS